MKITADFVGQDVKAYDLAEYETFVIEVEGKQLQIVRSKLAGMTPGRLAPSRISPQRSPGLATYGRYNAKFRADALVLAQKDVHEAARRLKVSAATLRKWGKATGVTLPTSHFQTPHSDETKKKAIALAKKLNSCAAAGRQLGIADTVISRWVRGQGLALANNARSRKAS